MAKSGPSVVLRISRRAKGPGCSSTNLEGRCRLGPGTCRALAPRGASGPLPAGPRFEPFCAGPFCARPLVFWSPVCGPLFDWPVLGALGAGDPPLTPQGVGLGSKGLGEGACGQCGQPRWSLKYPAVRRDLPVERSGVKRCRSGLMSTARPGRPQPQARVHRPSPGYPQARRDLSTVRRDQKKLR